MALPTCSDDQAGPVGSSESGLRRPTPDHFAVDQISEFVELIDRVKQKTIPLAEACPTDGSHSAKPPRFRPVIIIFGYFLSCIGSPCFSGLSCGLVDHRRNGHPGRLDGALVAQASPFTLLMPVAAAIFASTLVSADPHGLCFRFGKSAHYATDHLPAWRPADHRMIELASCTSFPLCEADLWRDHPLVFVYRHFDRNVFIRAGQLPGVRLRGGFLPLVGADPGHLTVRIGTFVRLSGAKIAIYFGSCWSSTLPCSANPSASVTSTPTLELFRGDAHGLCSEIIARSPRRTPAWSLKPSPSGFWCPVRGVLLSVTSLLSEDLQSAAIGLGEMVVLIISIALGVLLGTLLISPNKFRPGHCFQRPTSRSRA